MEYDNVSYETHGCRTMTDRQKQHLLGFLGLYNGAVDGVWGPKSREAALAFQRQWQIPEDDSFGLESQEKIRQILASGSENDWWQTIRYFTREEFRCRCGGKYCDGFPAEPSRTLVELADQVRGHFKKPALPSSGLRCSRHNSACGGVANSRHLTGKALDFRVQGIGASEVLRFVQTIPQVRYAYAIDGNYVHMDIE